MHTYIIEVYTDTAGAWRWRMRARNGRIVACSGECFCGRREAMRAARALAGARVVVG